jgi:hypothetical protein
MAASTPECPKPAFKAKQFSSQARPPVLAKRSPESSFARALMSLWLHEEKIAS